MSNYQESTLKCYTATGRASWNRNFYKIQPPCYWIVRQMTSSPVPATLPTLRDRQTDRRTDRQSLFKHDDFKSYAAYGVVHKNYT